MTWDYPYACGLSFLMIIKVNVTHFFQSGSISSLNLNYCLTVTSEINNVDIHFVVIKTRKDWHLAIFDQKMLISGLISYYQLYL